MTRPHTVERSIGLFGATGVGVGAIVGGGILALAGVAFATTGPSAIVAFALNGGIALITALSFAEMSTRFPESGGTYTFAKKVLSVEAAFLVGWVVLFASVVAGVLYALGFGAFAATAIMTLWDATGADAPDWLSGRWATVGLGGAATAVYAAGMVFRSGGGGQWINIAKVVVFAVLILGGVWAITKRSPGQIADTLTPFFAEGSIGLLQAMGFTFIALQGFDLIAAVAGEVKNPVRVLPRAMLYSLGAALSIYLPFLFVLATVGVEPGGSIYEASRGNEEVIVAVAAGEYLGEFGFWFVTVAAILSMLSALRANLYAASRVAFSMSRDRTLPKRLGRIHPKRGTPGAAVLATGASVIVVLAILGDVAAAGAVASLIFLVSFALAHWTSILARTRGGGEGVAFRVPWFPYLPIGGALACVGLAAFQGVAVPAAGLIGVVWLGVGGGLYLVLFARRARVVDAGIEAFDPQLARLRGRSPLVLVPIANPANAEAMVAVANALAPPHVGRVLLLSVVRPPHGSDPEERRQALVGAQLVLREALTASFERHLFPEAMTTIAAEPWPEIARVARVHRCESLLVGLSPHEEDIEGQPLERLIGKVATDVVVLRAPSGWGLKSVGRILVPVGGRGGHDVFRARLLGSFLRMGVREITFLRILPESARPGQIDHAQEELRRFAADEVRHDFDVEIVATSDVAGEIARHAKEYDLVILGLQRVSRRHKFFGDVAMTIARTTDTPLIMISRRG